MIANLSSPTYESLIEIAVKSSDGVVISSENLGKKIYEIIELCNKPILKFDEIKNEENSYVNFYNSHII